MAYGYQPKEKDAMTARARIDRVDASYRDLCNVCANVRGRRADKAIQFLSEALEKKRPIRYFRHNKRRGHLREFGGKKGGWPVKSVKIVLNVLQNAYANAMAKGMGECKIIHIAANKQEVYPRMAAKGRRNRQDFETAFVEIVLRELKTGEKKEAKPTETKKPTIAKPTPAEKKAETTPTAKPQATPAAKPAIPETKAVVVKKEEEKQVAKPIEAKKVDVKKEEKPKAELGEKKIEEKKKIETAKPKAESETKKVDVKKEEKPKIESETKKVEIKKEEEKKKVDNAKMEEKTKKPKMSEILKKQKNSRKAKKSN
ncbi:MAG: 50S ribosomal protein L22 [Candidatus Micrarchaeota archaeon]